MENGLYEHVLDWIKEAGQRLRHTVHQQLEIEYKTSAADIVTDKDKEIEQFFIKRIHTYYPDHHVLAEEGVAEQSTSVHSDYLWVIDPIDGTTNFVHQKLNFVVSVGIYYQGRPLIGAIYDPMRDELFHARNGHGAYINNERIHTPEPRGIESAVIALNGLWLMPHSTFNHQPLQQLIKRARGSRSMGAAALEMAYVACGRLDAYISMRLAPWDFGGGFVILDEVGIPLTSVQNEPIHVCHRSSVFTAPSTLHAEIWQQFLVDVQLNEQE